MAHSIARMKLHNKKQKQIQTMQQKILNLEEEMDNMVFSPNSVDRSQDLAALKMEQFQTAKILESFANAPIIEHLTDCSRMSGAGQMQCEINNKVTQLKQAEGSISTLSTDIAKASDMLQANQHAYSKYGTEIRNKMGVIATRDRMLQLSQERNMYKKKIIYVLLAIIIGLLIAVIAIYTFFSKKRGNSA